MHTVIRMNILVYIWRVFGLNSILNPGQVVE